MPVEDTGPAEAHAALGRPSARLHVEHDTTIGHARTAASVLGTEIDERLALRRPVSNSNWGQSRFTRFASATRARREATRSGPHNREPRQPFRPRRIWNSGREPRTFPALGPVGGCP